MSYRNELTLTEFDCSPDVLILAYSRLYRKRSADARASHPTAILEICGGSGAPPPDCVIRPTSSSLRSRVPLPQLRRRVTHFGELVSSTHLTEVWDRYVVWDIGSLIASKGCRFINALL